MHTPDFGMGTCLFEDSGNCPFTITGLAHILEADGNQDFLCGFVLFGFLKNDGKTGMDSICQCKWDWPRGKTDKEPKKYI